MPPLPGPAATPIAYFAMLDQKNKETVIEEVAEEAAARFRQYRDAIKEAVGLRDLRAADRLKLYTTRTPDVWARLQSLFPREYRDQQRDWYYLQRKIAQTAHPAAAQSTSLFGMRSTSPLPVAYTPNGGLGA